MAKSDNQKLKLLYILKILKEETNEDKPISTKDLINRLADFEIKAERKSIYSDMEYLKDFGYDIIFNANKINGGYYLGSREFELAELKILVDMVQSSRFLTLKKSRELISKLENLTDKINAGTLARSVYVANRVKSENESVFYSVDTLNEAMNSNKSVLFQYFQYSVNKEIKLKKDGLYYNVSPYYLVWSNENYYLVGVDNEKGEIRHYRVDRMKKLSISNEERQYKDLFKKFDIGDFSKAVFNMYDGEKTKITLVCNDNLINVIIDRFGKDIIIRNNNNGTFDVVTDVCTGPQFYGWLCGLNGQAKIKSPAQLATDFHEYVGKIYLLN